MRHNLIVSRNAKMIAFLRERYLGETWEVTDDPAIAIQALEREPFDRLFLDYWLDQEPANGRDVSLWLGQHPDLNARLEVFVTTDTPTKAQQMQAECGRVAHAIPFAVIEQLGT
jgi:hypothetical protein